MKLPAISDYQEEAMLDIFDRRMRAINDRYIKMIGKNVKKVLDGGILSSVSQARLIAMKQMGEDTRKIQEEIIKEINVSKSDVDSVMLRTAMAEYSFSKKYYDLSGKSQIPFKENKKLQNILRAQAKITNDEMVNLSRTTVVSDLYKNVIDEAIQAVQSGVGDYGTEFRLAMKKAAVEGLKVKYASGHTRRLDSAMRMNVLDGVRKVNQEVAIQTGKEYGADGYELSAHISCAEDHLPYQGKQYTKKQYEQLNDSLYRKIGEWNCRHFAFPILIGISQPAYSNKELKALNDYSSEKIEIDGKTKSRYEWTQVQRRLETEVRRQKDVWNLANEVGDNVLKRECNANINKIKEKYKYISEKANLPVKKERMTVSGYGKKYTKNEVPKQQIIKAFKKPKYLSSKDVVDNSKLKPLETILQLKQFAEESGSKFTPGFLSKSGFYEKFGYEKKLSAYQLKQIVDGKMNIDDVMAKLKKSDEKVIASAIVENKIGTVEEFIDEFNTGFKRYKNKKDARSLFERIKDNFTKTEIDALNKYTSSYFKGLNEYLRFGKKNTDKEYEKFIKIMDKAFAKAKTDKVYYSIRKLDSSVFTDLYGKDEKKWAGKIFEDKGYMSSSVSRHGFFGQLKMFIRVPEGANAVYIESISRYKEEAELLINRGARLRIVDAKKVDNSYEVYLDLITE